MVENADDDPVETKHSFVDYSGEFKPPEVEASVDVKPNIDETFVHIEASLNVDVLHVNSGVSQLGVNEVDTAHFFSSQVSWKDRDDMLSWILRQANKVRFTVVIQRSSITTKDFV